MCDECREVEIGDRAEDVEEIHRSLSGKTKVCKCCGVEKPVEEFQKDGLTKEGEPKHKKKCKVCCWFERREGRERFNNEFYIKILDLLLNKKIKYLNELCDIFSKNEDDIAKIVFELKIKNLDIRFLFKCSSYGCNNYIEIEPRRILNSKHSKFCCSRECQAKWQSEYLIGENSNTFSSIKIKCDWCNKEFYDNLYKFKKGIQENHFCCTRCRREWYAKVFSQDSSWKKECAKRATKLLTDGIFDNKETTIQTITNDLLKQLGIKFENEYNCKYVAMDNAIYYNNELYFIECMGTYWHTDIRKYDKISYEMQKNRIKLDKIKHSYIKNEYDIEILYLWEIDIIDNLELCKQLILNYVNNNGVLENYHSLNYQLDENNNLLVNKNIMIPYMEWGNEELNKIVDSSVKEIMSKKQEDKWISFNCEYCGKKREELISHYNKKQHHFCSMECSAKSRSKKIKVKCFNCGKELEIIETKYRKQKYFFCDKECQHMFQRNIGFKGNGAYIEFNCEYCNKLAKQKKCDYNKSTHHFCNKKCSRLYQVKLKQPIV